ncbi:dephospho-CoA kinase [Entomospira entomophila]|uniref:Dephospho-CoA kinase n=1 Tax=Entomospira entomophila TaxID=2719988 RepID=A0A968KR66_9SPIO|nr:dephospho-CoA kinase [Entomospira entomophilus]NIZ40469.1 dephospho-CoA kinase [Entomospira entomophilus]WDI36027.1 dephospho-CoA kinase [Entomospira entomophilus]
MVIGVSGKACTGKNVVSDMLASRGWLVIDADQIGQTALIELADEVKEAFASFDVWDEKKDTIDRKKLGSIVFADADALDRLNSLVHPHIVTSINKEIVLHRNTQHIVVNAALLPQVKIEGVDAILFVQASLWLRIYRAIHRDRRSIPFVLRRIWAQRHLRPQLFWKNVDIYYINNNRTTAVLEKNLNRILAKMKGSSCQKMEH